MGNEIPEGVFVGSLDMRGAEHRWDTASREANAAAQTTLAASTTVATVSTVIASSMESGENGLAVCSVTTGSPAATLHETTGKTTSAPIPVPRLPVQQPQCPGLFSSQKEIDTFVTI